MDTLHARLSRLEDMTERLDRSARRWRMTAAALAAAGTAMTLTAFSRPAAVPLVQTQRLEILSADGAVLAVIGGDDHGGRIDLWSLEGRNVFRASGNEHGGDLNIWNRNERTVAATFATAEGGALRLWNSDGDRTLSASSDASAGTLTLSAPSGPSLRLRAAGEDRMIAAHAGGDEPVLALGLHPAGGGQMLLADPAGLPLLRMEALPGGRSSVSMSDAAGRRRTMLAASGEGGALALENADGSAAAALGATDEGGFVDLHGARGARIFRASPNTFGGGSLALSAAAGTDIFTVESSEQGGATLALMNPRGRRAFVAGARVEGGVLNIFNRHDVAVIAASFAPEGLGGAISVRNGRGVAVAAVESVSDETGLIRVMDSEGERARRLAPLP